MTDQDHKVIKEIMAEAWGKYGDRLFVEEDSGDAVRKVAEIALKEEAHRFTDAEKGKIRAALKTGEYDKKIKVEDPKIAKKYTKYVEKRIKQEIKKGNLTKPPKDEKSNKKGTKRATGGAQKAGNK